MSFNFNFTIENLQYYRTSRSGWTGLIGKFLTLSIVHSFYIHIFGDYIHSGLQIRVLNGKLFFLFLNQNIFCGYSKELSQ